MTLREGSAVSTPNMNSVVWKLTEYQRFLYKFSLVSFLVAEATQQAIPLECWISYCQLSIEKSLIFLQIWYCAMYQYQSA